MRRRQRRPERHGLRPAMRASLIEQILDPRLAELRGQAAPSSTRRVPSGRCKGRRSGTIRLCAGGGVRRRVPGPERQMCPKPFAAAARRPKGTLPADAPETSDSKAPSFTRHEFSGLPGYSCTSQEGAETGMPGRIGPEGLARKDWPGRIGRFSVMIRDEPRSAAGTERPRNPGSGNNQKMNPNQNRGICHS